MASQAIHADPVNTFCTKQNNTCTLGVFPHLGLRQMEQTYSAIIEDLTLIFDKTFRFTTSSSLNRFNENLAAKKYDLALVGSPQLLSIAEKAGYIPLAGRAKDIRFHIIVRNNSKITNLQELQGKRFGRMPKDTSSYLVSQRLLSKQKMSYNDFSQTIEFGKQLACAHALLSQVVDGCIIASPVFEQLELQLGKNNFRTIATSAAYPNAIYIARQDLPKDVINEMRNYFLSKPGFKTANSDVYKSLYQ